MKTASFLACLILAGCASAPKAAPTAAAARTTAAAPAEPESKSALETWAESKVKKEEASAPKAKTGAMDPLAMNDDAEASWIPKIEKTPAKEVRPNSRAALQSGFGIVKASATTEEATKKLERALGKPTWIENGKKRVWIAKEGTKCHRLVFDTDGSVEVESASVSEERSITATARQNACTGEIKRGVK